MGTRIRVSIHNTTDNRNTCMTPRGHVIFTARAWLPLPCGHSSPFCVWQRHSVGCRSIKVGESVFGVSCLALPPQAHFTQGPPLQVRSIFLAVKDDSSSSGGSWIAADKLLDQVKEHLYKCAGGLKTDALCGSSCGLKAMRPLRFCSPCRSCLAKALAAAVRQMQR